MKFSDSINPNIKVNGSSLVSLLNSMKSFTSIGELLLKENNIANPTSDEDYPIHDVLKIYYNLLERVGKHTMNSVGKAIPENVLFPSNIKTIEDALSSIDIAYHMNHNLNGFSLFDPENGIMKEGIGHYLFKKKNESSAEIYCDNPYPCDFDIGIIEAMATKFNPLNKAVEITHKTEDCRKQGDSNCYYLVNWN